MAVTTDEVPGLRVVGFRAGENVVFFGNTLGVECQRCGAYNQTTTGHKFCAHVSCPIALREFKRRKRKRTSSLEKVYLPQFQAKLDEAPSRASSPRSPAEPELRALGASRAASTPTAARTPLDPAL